jgi:asparagine N-glycosylation enzyme membrane subunit Stt3
MLSVFISLAISISLGFLVYQSAEKRGMNAAAWSVVCALIPIASLLFLLIRAPLANSNDGPKSWRHLNRRLRAEKARAAYAAKMSQTQLS